ncbi:hypothetical protein [Parvularcula sp. LCG005]|uniref:hypothetical protein n=1 Tax=Parvularcula sp. LCG005 TaxID=3078805 RepID=UPI0029426F2B|nr:hypothetical protein [Parvularcula sp. LCG005]WOI53278.1 hypothetical protein RUI03_14115 [Parvularcula sp. LCG005]
MMDEAIADRMDRIVAADDAALAASFLLQFPDCTAHLRRLAEKHGAEAVVHEIDLLTTPRDEPSLDTEKVEVRLQGHSVLFGRDHAYLMVIVDDHPAFRDDPRFANTLDDGRRYATLGAGPKNLMPFFSSLLSGVNREADLSPLLHDTFDIEIQHPDVTAGKRTERAVVEQLFDTDAAYNDRLNYDIIPLAWSDGFNSNSFISGLLEVSGWNAARPGKVPGWDKPVPPEHFDRPEDEPPETAQVA